MAWLCGSGSEDVALPSDQKSKGSRAGRAAAEGRSANTAKQAALRKLTGGKAVARPPAHPSHAAVSLEWLLGAFLSENPQVEHDLLTTHDVVETIIKPATEGRMCRYADLVREESKSCVSSGKQFFFVSHPWDAPLVDTIAMLREHFNDTRQQMWRKDAPPMPWSEVYVWIDVFGLNQHSVSELGASRASLAMMNDVISDAVQTLLVLDEAGVLLTRMWCLYEAWRSRAKGDDALVLLTYDTDLHAMEQMLADLDVRCAVATEADDADALLAAIEKDVGAAAVTYGLKDAFVSSAVSRLPEQSEGLDTLMVAELSDAAFLCYVYGRYATSERLYNRALMAQENEIGDEDPETLTTVAALANVKRRQGRLAEAQSMAQRALRGRQSALGAKDAMTLESVDSLAAVLSDMGQHDNAEPLLKRSLKARQTDLGAEDPATLSSVQRLADLYMEWGKLDAATPLLQRALKTRERVLGADDNATLESVQAFAVLRCLQGKLDESDEMFQRALEGREQTLGAEHPRTLATVHNYAVLLAKEGHQAEAAPLFERAVDGRSSVLGPDHPDTLLSCEAKAQLHEEMDEMPEAEALLRRVVKARTRTLGAGHKLTLSSVQALAQVMRAQGKNPDTTVSSAKGTRKK